MVLKKNLSFLLFISIILVLLVGCGSFDPTKITILHKVSETKKIAIIVKGTENVFYQSLREGADIASKEANIDYYFTASSAGETDINGQISLVENAISQKVSGIIIAATDSKALVPVVEKAIAAGIPVVVVDSGLQTDQYASFLTTDTTTAVTSTVEVLAKSLHGKGKVALMNFVPGAQGAIDREKAFRAAMANYPDIEILPTQFYNNDKQKAFSMAQTILAANPDLDAIFTCNEPGTIGAGRALKEANNKKVIVYGFDSSDNIIPLLKEGYLKATIVQMPYNMGYFGVKTLVDKIAGKDIVTYKDTGFTLVTTENMETPESQKALYPLGKK